MSRHFITELTEQQQIDQPFLAADKQLRANRQGGKYVLLRLADRTGTLTGMLWNADERTFESFQRGDYIRCKGRTQLFNGNLQMIITEVSRLEPTEVDPADYERFDAAVADQLLGRLREMVGGLQNPSLRQLGEAFLDDEGLVARLRLAPAAVTHHHAYPGGLLRHSVDLMELVALVAPRYPQLDAELLLLGAFLHDLGKMEELSHGGEATYTDRGQLVGHIVIGVQLLAEKVAAVEKASGQPFPTEVRWQLEHLIVSHHGQLEFGSPKIPVTLEAIALHHLDNLDAKLASAVAVLQSDVAGDGNWTNFNPALGRKLWKRGVEV